MKAKSNSKQSPDESRFAQRLLEWFAINQRDLPWRRLNHDPYAVWVSEIMLQQTTVAAVVPFYERWMERFPTLHALAEAHIDDVLQHWAGLGYYARARNLHRGAQVVVQQFGSQMPHALDTVRALPGIGPYTAGAILSIAFNQEVPIVDANVERVLARLYALPGDPKKSAETKKQIWRLAEHLIPKGQARNFNQAMMELGALICTPASPRCDLCPVSKFCKAHNLGTPTAFPQFQNNKLWSSAEDVSVALQNNRGEFLFVQRPVTDPLWGGLWELPRVRRQQNETLEQCAARAACEIAGISIHQMTSFGSLKHVVGNRKITLSGYWFQIPAAQEVNDPENRLSNWVRLTEINQYALPTPQKRLIKLLENFLEQGHLEFG